MRTALGVGVWFLLLASVFAADEGPLIRGHVEDENGQVVSGASVVAVDRDGRRIETTTDAQGAFELPPVPEKQNLKVTITDPAKSRLWAQSIYYARGKTRPELKVTLVPSREVTVEVVDARGTPVEGAWVLLQKSFINLAALKTGPQGSVKLQVPMNPQATYIYALKSGVGYDYFSSLYNGENGETKDDREIPQPLKLKLAGARTVKVKAVDSKGKPLAGITINTGDVGRRGKPNNSSFAHFEQLRAKTGPDGIVVFDWLPTDIENLSIHGNHDEFSKERLDVSQENLATDFEMRFGRKTKLAGKVLLPDGKPAAGIKLVATGQGMNGQSSTAQATSDANGQFEMMVDPERGYVLYADDEKWADNLRIVIVREGKPDDQLRFKLAKGTVITGQVIRGAKREPGQGIDISLQLPGGIYVRMEDPRNPGQLSTIPLYFNRSVQTDDEGRYRFVAGPGSFVLRGPTRLPPVNLSVSNEGPIVHDFYLPRADFVPLVGTVVDVDGKPVADAQVQGYYGGLNHQRSAFKAKCNAEGRFEEERETVPLVVRVTSPDKKLARIVSFGEEEEECRIELLPTATVRGKLIDPARNPAIGQQVDYYVRVPQEDETSPTGRMPLAAFLGRVTTDEYGLFEIPELAVGANWSIGPRFVMLNKPGDVELGDSTQPEGTQHRRPLPERLAQYFKQQDDPAERIAQAKKFADGQFLRMMLIVGDPSSDVAGQFVQLLDSEISIAASLADFEPLVISTADKPAMELLKQNYGLDGERLSPLSLVILGSDGKPRAVHNWSLANKDDKQPAQVIQEFVTPQALPFPEANLLLEEALAQARREDKQVLLMESTTNCVLCRPLLRLFDRHPKIFDANFVILRIDPIRYENGQEVIQIYRPTTGSIPWCAVLDADGKKLADWDGQNGNIGFPVLPREIEYFLKVLSQTVPKVTPEQLAELRKDLEQQRKKPAK